MTTKFTSFDRHASFIRGNAVEDIQTIVLFAETYNWDAANILEKTKAILEKQANELKEAHKLY